MGDMLLTRPSLLLRVRDHQDHQAWGQFVELYAPLVYQFARKRGLQDADAADLAQTVFQEIARDIRKLDYDPARGTFRGWLLGVVRNQLHKQLARSRQGVAAGGSGSLDRIPQPESDEDLWDQQYKLRLFRVAAERMRVDFQPATWQAFWRTAVLGQGAKVVAAELEMSIGAVYTAKSRVLDRIKQTIEQLQAEEQVPEEISDREV